MTDSRNDQSAVDDDDDDDGGRDPGQAARDSSGAPSIDRRTMLGRIALGSGALVAGAVGGAAASATGIAAGGWKRETVTFDVACLGETWRDSLVNYAANASDFRGMPFAVEGWIYPEGTIPMPGDGFVPTQDGSIGRWLCRGSTLVYADRPEPHVQTSQEFVFSSMSGDDLFPDDLLSTSGIEGSNQPELVAHRSVVGGIGRYLGASGVQHQEMNGLNTSIFTDGTGAAPNFRMRFELLLPDV
jgi:hypothetical protein